jgi:hypothetical protein
MAKITITFRSLLQRLNRRLAQDNEIIRSPRGRASRESMGDYYLLDTKLNGVVKLDLSPAEIENMGRELGVLKAWEEVR